MANKGSFLATGQYLSVNDYLVSDNGEFFAVMQSDGNFVLYRGSGPSDNQGYIWSISHTSLPTGQYFAIMQADGNFVVYHGSDPAHQGTPIWATNTFWVSHRVTTGDSLTADDWMGTNDYLLSQNQLFAACMQDDGNFVLSYTTYSTSPTVRPRPDPSRPYGATNTVQNLRGQYIAVYKADGNFILHHGPASGEEKDLTSYWSSSWYRGSRNQNAPIQAIMQDDGNFVLYQRDASGQQQPYWWTFPPISFVSPIGRTDNRVTGRSFLLGGEELDAQDCLVSSNGFYFAVMQSNGGFILYHTASDANTGNTSPDFDCGYAVVCSIQGVAIQPNQYFVTMQTDGNFVLYWRSDGHQYPYWASNTAHSSPGQYIAVLHDTGNFAIYSGSDPKQVSENTRLWQSNTALDPTTYFMKKHSGDNQNLKGTLAMGNYIPLAPLVVQVKHQNGQPAPNVPVNFDLGAAYYPPQGSGMDVRLGGPILTDQNGVARLEQASVNCYTQGGCYVPIIATVANSGSVTFTLHISSS